MFQICTGLVVLLGVHAIRLPLIGSPDEYNDLPIGSPQSVPPSNTSGGLVGTLSLPLNPSEHLNLKQRFTFGAARAGTFKGGHLIASIIQRLYTCWKNTANAPILGFEEDRVSPFLNILHTIHPSLLPGAVLSPLKVEVVYSWMIKEVVLRQQHWPGRITASVYNADHSGRLGLPLGVINVENSPSFRTESISPSLGDTSQVSAFIETGNDRIVTNVSTSTNSELSAISKSIREKSWLDCYIQIMLYILEHPASASVLSTFPLPAYSATLHFRSTIDVKMEGNLTVTRDTGTLKWDHLARVLMKLGVEAATEDQWENTESTRISMDGRIIAKISFGRTWRPGRGGVPVGDGAEMTSM